MTAEELMLITNESLDRIRESLRQYVVEHYIIPTHIRKHNNDLVTMIYSITNHLGEKEIYVTVISEDKEFEISIDMLNLDEIYEIICGLLED